MTKIRKGQVAESLSREEFAHRFRQKFVDSTFDAMRAEIEALLNIAWSNHEKSRKAPHTRKAGEEFFDPDYDLSVEWLEARRNIQQAAQAHADPRGAPQVLLICASARNDETCPGEMSKTFRLVTLAQRTLQEQGVGVDLLDLSTLTSEYSKVIYPCKACVSTAMPLCHWPCSCYPNHSLGQVNDWMNELYPRWVAAHGIMIITPVYWYQSPSVLKLMMERLVCADGGNPDPTRTHGKNVAEAKALELADWPYPRHLAGRAFSVVVHGDTAGSDTLRRSLVDWLNDMELIQAGRAAAFDRYIGYYEPYATSHDALDADTALHEEVKNAALSLANEIQSIRQGRREPDQDLAEARPK